MYLDVATTRCTTDIAPPKVTSSIWLMTMVLFRTKVGLKCRPVVICITIVQLQPPPLPVTRYFDDIIEVLQ